MLCIRCSKVCFVSAIKWKKGWCRCLHTPWSWMDTVLRGDHNWWVCRPDRLAWIGTLVPRAEAKPACDSKGPAILCNEKKHAFSAVCQTHAVWSLEWYVNVSQSWNQKLSLQLWKTSGAEKAGSCEPLPWKLRQLFFMPEGLVESRKHTCFQKLAQIALKLADARFWPQSCRWSFNNKFCLLPHLMTCKERHGNWPQFDWLWSSFSLQLGKLDTLRLSCDNKSSVYSCPASTKARTTIRPIANSRLQFSYSNFIVREVQQISTDQQLSLMLVEKFDQLMCYLHLFLSLSLSLVLTLALRGHIRSWCWLFGSGTQKCCSWSPGSSEEVLALQQQQTKLPLQKYWLFGSSTSCLKVLHIAQSTSTTSSAAPKSQCHYRRAGTSGALRLGDMLRLLSHHFGLPE